jgi:small subunit ribosomal protein S17
MAEETENTEETETPAAPDEAAAVTDAPTGDAPAPEAEAPAEEAPAPAEPEVILSPKERRQQRRTAAVEKRGARRAATPEQRVEERKRKAAERRRYRARLKERRAAAPKAEHEQGEHATAESTGHKRVRQGVVVSDKADKTITVKLEVVRRHRRYHKTIRTSQTLHAHDERNDAHVGDTVRVVEARPLSRTKRWRLVEVVERAR